MTPATTDGAGEKWNLKLYTAGQSPKSLAALDNLKRVCEQHLAGRYSIEGLTSLDVEQWESAHGGFNTKILNTRSPDYGLPLRTLREFEAQGVIAGIHPWIYSTVGNQTAVGPARAIGRRVAQEFRDAGVAAALQVSG